MKRIFPLRLIVFLLLIACALAAAPYQMKTAKDSNGFTYQYVPDDPFGGRVYTLSNGMRLYLSRNDRQPRIQTYVAVRAGAADDPLESTGLAHYFEHMMFKGNHRIASLDWEKEKPLLDELEQLFEQQHPDEVEPAEEQTTANGHDHADDQAKKTALLRPSGPSYHNLGYQVYKGNDEEQQLNQTALLIEPSHESLPPM